MRGQRWEERNGGREEEDDFVRLAGAATPWAAGFQRGREEKGRAFWGGGAPFVLERGRSVFVVVFFF